MFQLDPRLDGDTFHIEDLGLSRLVLMNDQTYPWVILVPRIPGITELHHLGDTECETLMTEIKMLSALMAELFQPDSINCAALGNVVSQLHVHILARFHTDPCWPGPVWGKNPPVPYEPNMKEAMIEKMRKGLIKTSVV